MLLKNDKKIMIGYDLANTFSQISYCYKKEESDVETVGTVEGEENYDIPTVLCKRAGTNQWLFGYDAVRFCKENPQEGILVENLLELALGEEAVQIEGKAYQPAALLSLFIKRSLSTLGISGNGERVAGIMFTCEKVDERIRSLIQRVEKTLDLKSAQIFCQSYEESFFSYMTCQPRNLWESSVLLLDYRARDLTAMFMECNENTMPPVMYSEKVRYQFAGTDRELLDIAGDLCEKRQISSVYLIGERFSRDWMEESLRYLCSGRRVFQGNNLYSKGAVYTLRRQMGTGGEEPGTDFIFLGPDKLKANVGMRVQKRGENAYNALLDAGMDWKRLEEYFEFYLKGETNIELLITPVLKCPVKHVLIELEGMELAPEEVTRVRLKCTMPEENKMLVTVTDLGFGEFRQSMDGKWTRVVEIY